MSSKKPRVDVSAEPTPLTDNPFGALKPLLGAVSGEPKAGDPRPPKTTAPKPAFQVARTRKGDYPVFLEKRAAGKTVTVIRNVTGDADALLSLLRKKCGAGGAVREGEVELQGDHRAKVQAFLKEG